LNEFKMAKSKKGASRWLPLVLLNSLLIQAGIYVVRPIITYKSVELGADAALVGLIGASFAIAPLVFAIQIGRFVDRGRAGLALLLGSIILVLTTVALLFINSIALLMLAMPSLGMGHLLVMVGGQTLIANRSNSKEYEKNFGLLTFYASAGHAIGPFVGGYLADSGEVNVNANAAFLFALALFVAAVIGTIALSTKKENPKNIKPLEKARVTQVLAIPTFKSAIFVASATTAVVDVVLIFLPLYGREIGLSVTDIGILLAIRAIFSLAVRLVLGQISNRLGLRRIVTWGSLVTLVSMVALGLTSNFWWIALIMAVSGFAMGIGQPATMAWVSRISSPESRGLAISIRLGANRFGQVAMPAIAGVVAGASTAGVFYMLAALQAASIVATVTSLKKGE
jgi:MFS family permease